MDRVSTWCKANKLTVNTSKTQVLWSYSQRLPPDLNDADLYMDGQPLEVVTQFKYLGVVIDRFLCFGPHLKKRIDLVRTRLKQLRRVRRASDKATSLQVYVTMIRSIMEHCGFVTDGGPVWATRKMQTLQNDALRICECIRDPRGVDIDALHTRNQIPKLVRARDKELLSYMHKMSQDQNNVLQAPRILRGNRGVLLKVPRSKKAVFDRSPMYRGLPLWDELDPDVQRLPYTAFVNHLKH